ncbi:MAG TPA: hypothetical protein VGQ59_03025 [Cyclobacteriaceae bacterium]|nr:hypothetical protein [Cyclobacteriaceae bacterium]
MNIKPNADYTVAIKFIHNPKFKAANTTRKITIIKMNITIPTVGISVFGGRPKTILIKSVRACFITSTI